MLFFKCVQRLPFCFTYLTLRFSKKEQWFKEYWMLVSKPKHAGVRDRDKGENNI